MTCMTGPREVETVVKKLLTEIMSGVISHNDHAKYQLALQVNIYGGRQILQKDDMKDMFSRISAIPLASSFPAVAVMAAVPNSIKDHVGDHETFKIEWMMSGRYICSMSESYATNITEENSIRAIAVRHGIPPKLVDYCNLAESDIAYRMWCESLMHPSRPVSFTGTGLWKSSWSVCHMTVRIMSVIINPEYIITATTCGTSKKYVFGSLP